MDEPSIRLRTKGNAFMFVALDRGIVNGLQYRHLVKRLE
jgi:hypothetical protein